jgi:hypothetical protein
MAKRPRRLDPGQENLPEYLRTYKPTGLGVPDSVVDREFWHGDETTELGPWLMALEAIDKRADKAPLINLLKSDCSLPRSIRWYLADLLRRYALRKLRGAQATPAYDRTFTEAKLEWAHLLMLEYIEQGKSVREAGEQAAKERAVPEQHLDDYHKGRRTSTRRMKQHRP